MVQKAIFQRLDDSLNAIPGSDVEVSYNPTEVTLNKGAQIADINIPGLDMPVLQFVRGQTETLTMDLFFDSTEDGMGDQATPVTKKTDQFYQLVKIDRDRHAPPVCRFIWGKEGFPGSQMDGKWSSQRRTNGFQCIVESVRQRFTLFNPRGIPLRATLTVTLREYKTLEDQLTEIDFHSSDHTHAHVVQRGDTLSRIAYKVYGDPLQWRAIARQNGIVDPLDLPPGLVLEIPALH
jgi:nucleoid-associated protein YgaU